MSANPHALTLAHIFAHADGIECQGCTPTGETTMNAMDLVRDSKSGAFGRIQSISGQTALVWWESDEEATPANLDQIVPA